MNFDDLFDKLTVDYPDKSASKNPDKNNKSNSGLLEDTTGFVDNNVTHSVIKEQENPSNSIINKGINETDSNNIIVNNDPDNTIVDNNTLDNTNISINSDNVVVDTSIGNVDYLLDNIAHEHTNNNNIETIVLPDIDTNDNIGFDNISVSSLDIEDAVIKDKDFNNNTDNNNSEVEKTGKQKKRDKKNSKDKKPKRGFFRKQENVTQKENVNVEKENKKTPVSRKKIATISLIGLSTVLIVGGIFLSLFLSSYKTVPAANKEFSKNSCLKFEQAGFECKTKFVYDDSNSGLLVNQTPKQGVKTRKNSVVLSYSKGPVMSTVPELSGLSLFDTKKTLSLLGLKLGSITFVDNSSVDKGRVVSSSFVGKQVRNGTRIDVDVASGNNIAPDWVNKDKTFVVVDSKKNNIDVEFVYETSNLPNDVVVSQSVKPGEKMFTNKMKVVLSQNNEQKKIVVPNIVGMSGEEAELKLASLGFKKINTVTVSTSKVKENKVTNMFPQPETQILDNENIVIIVSIPE